VHFSSAKGFPSAVCTCAVASYPKGLLPFQNCRSRSNPVMVYPRTVYTDLNGLGSWPNGIKLGQAKKGG
jgi:hypothetical protein